MKFWVGIAALLILAAPGWAERRKLSIDPEAPDSLLLQRIQQEPLAARKRALLEQYTQQFPKNDAAAWVYEQLLSSYLESKDQDKALWAGERLVETDASDLNALNVCLRTAEERKDTDRIRRYAVLSWDAGSKAGAKPKPADPDQAQDWKEQVEYGRQLAAYAEYALFNLSRADAAHKSDYLALIAARNPRSKYLTAQTHRVVGYAPLDSSERGVADAERRLPQEPDNEDLLMLVAEYHMQHESEPEKVIRYSLHVLEILPHKSAPEGMTKAEWGKKCTTYTGAANWMAGILYAREGRFGLADQHLRATLPYVQGNDKLLSAALFYLGYSNFVIGEQIQDKSRIAEALRFSKKCLELRGPFQAQATKNLELIRTRYNME